MKLRRAVFREIWVLGILGVFIFLLAGQHQETAGGVESSADVGSNVDVENNIWMELETDRDGQGENQTKDFIQWVDFQVSSEAMKKAMEIDIETYSSEAHIPWTVLLAYCATQNGGKVTAKDVSAIEKLAKAIQSGEMSLENLGEGKKYYNYYLEVYEAVFSGFLGEYEIFEASAGQEDNSKAAGQENSEKATGQAADVQEGVWKKVYGLKAFHPIAKGFDFSDYDDFGVSRTYGYKRRHLGHDMMGLVGTPIIAVESGYVEVLGWNQYGGWRIGIRSFDKKRYYYYAHLRQNYPFAEGLKEGDAVTAGDVIGYMGHTGYSQKENVNNIETTHLHFGLQLIFDESQKECDNEIWIDCYQLVRFLYQNRSEASKIGDTREWKRVRDIRDPAVEAYQETAGGEETKATSGAVGK